jgi:photosystem II stability/assembly factor-like uncharacterized protein
MKIIKTLLMLITFSLCSFAQEGLFSLRAPIYRTVQFVNDNVGWLMADGFINHTIDGGETWKVQLSLGSKITNNDEYNPDKYTFVDSKFFDENNGWILAYSLYSKKNIVFKTINGGDDWVKYDVNIDVPIIDCKPGIVFISESVAYFFNNEHFYKTIDGGITWESISTTPRYRTISDCYFTDENTGWYVFLETTTGISKTTDGGVTWNDIPMTTTEQADCIWVNGSTIWVGGRDGLLKSTDTGNTWEKISDNPVYNIQFFDLQNGFSCNQQHSGTGFWGTYKTLDGGISWTKVSDYGQRNYFSFNKYWIIQNRGLLKYSSGGDVATRQLWDTRLNDLEAIDSQNIIAVGEDAGIFKSVDGGLSWNINESFYQNFQGANLAEIEFAGTDVGVICGSKSGRGYVWQTNDRGISWHVTLDTSIYYSNFERLEYSDGRYFLFDENIIYISDDFGSSWTKLNSNTPGSSVSTSCFITNNIGYVVGNTANNPSKLSKTTDGGQNWTVIMEGYLDYSSLNFGNSYGYINPSSGGLLKTIDGGITFNQVSDVGYLGDIIFLNENDGISVAGGLHITSNGGVDWELKSVDKGRDPSFVSQDVGWLLSNDAIVYGTKHVGNVTDGIVSVDDNNNLLPTKYSLSQNYPNPFNPSTIINYQIPKAGFVTLKIYDILGKEVAELVNEEKVAGKYKVEFDASQLSSGVYFYQLQASIFVQTKKMILLH